MTDKILIAIALVATACATAKPKPSASSSAPELPALPRSSIAAVLEHRDELALTEEQVRLLHELDEGLQRENAALREEVAQQRQAAGQPTRGGLGGGMGRRTRGGMGGRPGGEGGGASNYPPRANSPMQRADDNDTKAYLAAETLLTEEQRPRAREIAERYREKLSERRETMRKRGER